MNKSKKQISEKLLVAVFINSHVDILKNNVRYMNLSAYGVIVVSPISRKSLEPIIVGDFEHIHVPFSQGFDENFIELCNYVKGIDDDTWVLPLADDDLILASMNIDGERIGDISEEIEGAANRGADFVLFEHAEYSESSTTGQFVMRESAQFLQRDREIVRIDSMVSSYLVSLPRFCGIAYKASLLKNTEIGKFSGTLHAYAAPMYLGVMNGCFGDFVPSPRFAYYAPEHKSWSWTSRGRIFLGIMHFASLLTFLGYDERAFDEWPSRFRILLPP